MDPHLLALGLPGVDPGAFDSIYAVAAVWLGLALIASLISIRAGLSVALVEILIGAFAGNVFHLAPNDWINFLASFGSVLLTFLAGAEIDPASFRRFLKPSLAIGGVGFFAPFGGAWAFPSSRSTGTGRRARSRASLSRRPRWPWSTR